MLRPFMRAKRPTLDQYCGSAPKRRGVWRYCHAPRIIEPRPIGAIIGVKKRAHGALQASCSTWNKSHGRSGKIIFERRLAAPWATASTAISGVRIGHSAYAGRRAVVPGPETTLLRRKQARPCRDEVFKAPRRFLRGGWGIPPERAPRGCLRPCAEWQSLRVCGRTGPPCLVCRWA
jgi:hypothetical protein